MKVLAGTGSIRKALRVARNDESGQGEPEAAIVKVLAKSGDIAGARRVASMITNQDSRSAAFVALTAAYIEIGNTHQAELQAAAITNEYARVRALIEITRALAIGGNGRETERVASQAEDLIRTTITLTHQRASIFLDRTCLGP